MSFEQNVNYCLNRYPNIKKRVKRIYQKVNYAISPKVKSEGEIVRISPDDSTHEYFFGYYDKSPWDASGRYVLCLKAKNTWSEVAPKEPAEIILIDTEENNRVRAIATTHSWNVQQGCMAQWRGPDFDKEIIYNDFRNGSFCSVILDVFSGDEQVLDMPVYSVSQDGRMALTLDFARLHRLRPGYGYSNMEDKTKNEKVPDSACIWKLNLETGEVNEVLKYKDFVRFEMRPEMERAEHKVNHIMISPNGKRFMVLHRWFCGKRKYSRLITVNVDGSAMFNLNDDDMVSHCCWKNDREILAFENKDGMGAGYYLMRDQSSSFQRLWPHIISDGHPSYSPDGRTVVTDTYPNRKRMAIIKILNEDFNVVIARVFAPFKYDNDTRCDLHPRWSRDGKKICFDSVFEGHRGLYMVSVSDIKIAQGDTTGTMIRTVQDNKKKIRLLYLMTSCRKSGPTQQTLNIIKNLDPEIFEPILITIYDEQIDSCLADYLPYVSAHYLVKTGKKDILLGNLRKLEAALKQLDPDVIHSVGVFPEFAVKKLKYSSKQITTLHNYMYDDYPAKYGKIKGRFIARLQLSTVKKARQVIACSESLSKIYYKKLNLSVEFIRNGVDVSLYKRPSQKERLEYRKLLDLPIDSFIFIYTGQFIERKNVAFLLKYFVEQFDGFNDVYLVLLGDGPELEKLRNKYGKQNRIDFRGSVSNVNEYLSACDVYISASKSEGLPYGVLEALAVGLPVVLSDIQQHKEVVEVDSTSGEIFIQGNPEDYKRKLLNIYKRDWIRASETACRVVHTAFDARKMSELYQNEYKKIACKN